MLEGYFQSLQQSQLQTRTCYPTEEGCPLVQVRAVLQHACTFSEVCPECPSALGTFALTRALSPETASFCGKSCPFLGIHPPPEPPSSPGRRGALGEEQRCVPGAARGGYWLLPGSDCARLPCSHVPGQPGPARQPQPGWRRGEGGQRGSLVGLPLSIPSAGCSRSLAACGPLLAWAAGRRHRGTRGWPGPAQRQHRTGREAR